MKIVSLFSVVRGYNIPIIILAQYLAAILAPEKGALNILLDFDLFTVFASSLSIASGYIINFYDSQKT
jgi:4-hydroxybenzoate polyprenyltransferase